MIHNVLFAAALCAQMSVQSRLEIPLAEWSQRGCTEASQITFNGAADALQWKGVNLTNANFNGVQWERMQWFNGSFGNLYFREVQAKSVEWSDVQLNSVEIYKSTLRDWSIANAGGGYWLMDHVTLASLNLKSVNFVEWRVNQMQADTVDIEGGKGEDLHWENFAIGSLILKAPLENWGMLNSSVGAVRIAGTRVDGWQLKNTNWSAGSIQSGDFRNLSFNAVVWSDLKLKDVALRGGSALAVSLRGVEVEGGVWNGLRIAASSFEATVFKSVLFAGVIFDRLATVGVTFENVHFANSDLRGLGFAPGARFVNCTYDAQTSLPWTQSQAENLGLKLKTADPAPQLRPQ